MGTILTLVSDVFQQPSPPTRGFDETTAETPPRNLERSAVGHSLPIQLKTFFLLNTNFI